MLTLNRTHLIIYIVAGVAIFIAVAMLLHTCSQNSQLAQDKKELASIIAANQDTTRYYKNAYGEELATRMVAQGSADNLKKAYDLAADAARLNTTVSNLMSYVAAAQAGTSHLTPQGQANVVYRDRPVYINGKDTFRAVSYMEQTFENPYYTAHVRIGDSAYHVLDARDTVRVGMHWTIKRSGFLNLKKEAVPEVTVQNANPDIHTKILTAYDIPPKIVQPARWSIALFTGYGYPLGGLGKGGLVNGLKTQSQFVLGLGVSRNLIKLR